MSGADEHNKDFNFSPREFLRARRPEYFSDSEVEDGPALDRQILEYHIETLTNRNEETAFEQFARAVAEREICPNLMPHTGPTGGGDSKVDTETYPVANELTFAWFVGLANEAARERWAFAFSAKKDWRPKLKSDAAKIALTGRGYSKAFLISSQYVPDKKRSDLEDQLSKAHGFNFRILDRSWLLDRVFAGKMEDVAIRTLNLSPHLRKQIRKGALDLQRERELECLETRIKDATTEQHMDVQFVADCIETAELSRSLERPRAETEGRLLRAQRAADKYGDSHQRVLAAYCRAWTTFWWHEDSQQFAELYSDVERTVQGTTNANDLQLLFNLWFILQTLVNKQTVSKPKGMLKSRTTFLNVELRRVGSDVSRPSAALLAKSLRMQIALYVAVSTDKPKKVDAALRGLLEVVHDLSGLIGFPFHPLVKVLTEMGSVLEEFSVYAELFEATVQLSAQRDGEVSAAILLCRRGSQQLQQDKPYDAIRTLGRALGKLYKHETRDELVKVLYLCGLAYERIGLLWAARGSLVMGASLALDEFWTHSRITAPQAACCNRVKWLELQLGRVPHSLAWHEVDLAITHQMKGPVGETGEPDEQHHFSGILGILLLKADLHQLKVLSNLPDVLERLQLYSSSIALLFALGHENALPVELIQSYSSEDSLINFFRKWRDQPVADDIAPRPRSYLINA